MKWNINTFMESQKLANPMSWWKWFKFSGLWKESVTKGKQNNHSVQNHTTYLSLLSLWEKMHQSKVEKCMRHIYFWLSYTEKKGGLVASQYNIAEGKLDAMLTQLQMKVICCLCKRHGWFTWRLISNGFCKQQSRTHAM